MRQVLGSVFFALTATVSVALIGDVSIAQAHEINDYPGNPIETWVCPGPPGLTDADTEIEFNKHASSTFSIVITYHSYAFANGRVHIDHGNGPGQAVILNGKKCRLRVTPPNAE
jgi:hypothetical protein